MNRDRTTGLFAALVVAAPVLVGLTYSLLGSVGLAGAGAGGFTWSRLLGLFDSQVLRGTAWSLWVAFWSTLIATGVAALVATSFRGARRSDRAAQLLAAVPLPLPHLAAAVLGVMVLGQSGLLARLAHAAGMIPTPGAMPALVNDPWGFGAIAVLSWKEFPFLALIAFSLLAGRGNALAEAARTLGAPPRAVFRQVIWPVLWRGMMPAIVAVFAFVAGTYEATVLLAPSDPLALPLLTMERYTDAGLDGRGDAYALVLLAMGVTFAAVAVHEVARARLHRIDRA